MSKAAPDAAVCKYFPSGARYQVKNKANKSDIQLSVLTEQGGTFSGFFGGHRKELQFHTSTGLKMRLKQFKIDPQKKTIILTILSFISYFIKF